MNYADVAEVKLAYPKSSFVSKNKAERLLQEIEKSRQIFRDKLLAVEQSGGMTQAHYERYLSMQYHLTKDVQKYFLAIAGTPKVMKNNKLRNFLLEFAIVEYPHYEVARKDLKNLGTEPFAMPFDTELWHTYFWSVVHEHPFWRLGAACILENISQGCNDVIDRQFAKAPFLNKKNTVFFTIHKHEKEIPHGDEILEAISNCDEKDFEELVIGAKKGANLYLRMVDSVFSGKEYF